MLGRQPGARNTAGRRISSRPMPGLQTDGRPGTANFANVLPPLSPGDRRIDTFARVPKDHPCIAGKANATANWCGLVAPPGLADGDSGLPDPRGRPRLAAALAGAGGGFRAGPATACPRINFRKMEMKLLTAFWMKRWEPSLEHFGRINKESHHYEKILRFNRCSGLHDPRHFCEGRRRCGTKFSQM